MIRKVGGIYFIKVGSLGGSFYMTKPKRPLDIPGIWFAIKATAAANCLIWSAVALKALGF